MSPREQTVLIFDSDEATCELYRRELGQYFIVLVARDERSAWQQVERGTVNAIILEPTALADEAWSFIARLRALEQYHDMPIILCSTLDARKRGAALGIKTCLIKPVAPHLLSRAVQAALHGEKAITGR